MGIPQKSLVIGACEIACHYPELSLNDAAGDALQLAEKIRRYGIEENQNGKPMGMCSLMGLGRGTR